MSNRNRRSVLTAGAALSTGGLFASLGAADSDRTGQSRDPEFDVDAVSDEDWPSYRGGPGHARFVPDGPEFDGRDLEAAWSADHDGAVAVADDTVYTATTDGVVALETEDGTTVWENDDVEATGPAVGGESVSLRGDEIVALDRADGSVRWESDLGVEEWTGSHTVAYGAVYTVADGTLYALEADDGSVRWTTDSVGFVFSFNAFKPSSDEFTTGTAASNGLVYAGTGSGPVAFDPETGDEVWRSRRPYADGTDREIYATPDAVLVGGYSSTECGIHDAETGEFRGSASTESIHEPALGEETYFADTSHAFAAGSLEDGADDWQRAGRDSHGQGVVCGETVYVYFRTAGDPSEVPYHEELVAFDRGDGSEKWTLSRKRAPVGEIRAISGDTVYVDYEGELVALRDLDG
ncbi:PQQ-binding-like beta-propeller repeat protein [Natronococcus sp.]|uniref:PQQ-binding-like beta-propeller repeat protein n=1 Tax=Natronococcus sp. TaxID=35747 RepID=UPI003A4DE1C1